MGHDIKLLDTENINCAFVVVLHFQCHCKVNNHESATLHPLFKFKTALTVLFAVAATHVFFIYWYMYTC